MPTASAILAPVLSVLGAQLLAALATVGALLFVPACLFVSFWWLVWMLWPEQASWIASFHSASCAPSGSFGDGWFRQGAAGSGRASSGAAPGVGPDGELSTVWAVPGSGSGNYDFFA